MPFHAAQANMAALLRSSRLLKISPSGLLQLTATNRTGPPLGRLYSGALGCGRTGVCSRLITAALEKASCSRAWPYAVGCVRRYALASEKEEASNAFQLGHTHKFDLALAKMDNSVRRTGRITKTLLLQVFKDICREGHASGNMALLMLRSCGSLLAELPLENRTELAHRMWDKLQEMGAQFDVSHYNALLKIYLQNEFKFSPIDFLSKMEAANVQPNRVTYQRLIAAYCENGDIKGASTILSLMKEQDLPITEAVFNALVTGHSRVGDMENAKNILSVMQQAGLEPGPDSYVSLLKAYAEKGDLASLKTTLEEAARADCQLMNRDIMQVIFTLAKAGYQQHVPEMVEHLRQESGHVQDTMNLCLNLITLGKEDTAFLILQNFSKLQTADNGINQGNFFLRHCVNVDMDVQKIIHFCAELQKANLHTEPYTFSLQCALEAKNTDMSLELMNVMKNQDLPVRPHFFWPLLTHYGKVNNTAGLLELVKNMYKLRVFPDMDTFLNYVTPAFPSIDAAQQALVDAGAPLKSNELVSLKVRMLAATNLASLYTLLSDPSFASFDQTIFRNGLIMGFKKSDDLGTMVKITELLYKDKRFTNENTNPADETSNFLYNLLDSMSMRAMKAKEDLLRKYVKELAALKITIPAKTYRAIAGVLESYGVPGLMEDMKALVDLTDVGDTVLHSNMEYQGRTRFRNMFYALCAEEKLERALELKEKHEEEMTAGTYAVLISLCCRHGNVGEALNLKKELSLKDSSSVLDNGKYMLLFKVLCKQGRLEEAMDLLKEMKEKKVVLNEANVTSLIQALGTLAVKNGAPAIQRLQDAILTLGLAKPSINLCSPLITAYIESDDLSGALEAAQECHKRYKLLPHINSILVSMVEKGDTELLQKATDFLSQIHGEMQMLYYLFFAFLQTGRYREARKIIETPGLRARARRLQWYAQKCIAANQMEALEQMVKMTVKLFDCDRDEMYSYLLRLCKETNNWQKAMEVWTKMQEENIVPRENTLRLLAEILKSNGQEVPFDVPEAWYEEIVAKEQVNPPTTNEHITEYLERLSDLCSNGEITEAYQMLQKANNEGVKFGHRNYESLIRELLRTGAIEEALAVNDIAVSRLPDFKMSNFSSALLIDLYSDNGQIKDALEKLRDVLAAKSVPPKLTVIKLVEAMSLQGDVAGIEEVVSLTKNLSRPINLPSVMLVQNRALALINSGDTEAGVEALDSALTGPDGQKLRLAPIFRRVLEQGSEDAIDKLSVMAERLANHFACYTPAVQLFLVLLDMERFEDAKFMAGRCSSFLGGQRDMLMSFLTRKGRRTGESKKIRTLMNLVPDFVEKEVQYTYLMKSYIQDKDFASAKALYEEMLKEGVNIGELTLKRLAWLHELVGETPPFPVPPESFSFYAEKLKAERKAQAKTAAEE